MHRMAVPAVQPIFCWTYSPPDGPDDTQCESILQASLAPAKAAPTALALEGATAATTAAATTTAVTAEPTRTGRAADPRRTILSRIDVQLPTIQIVPVEHPNGLRGLVFAGELDKCKSARPARRTIGGKIHVHDLPCRRQETGQFTFARCVVEIAHKHFC